MQTTIDLPDPLMAEVKSLADHEQRELDELMVELVRTGLEIGVLGLRTFETCFRPSRRSRLTG